MSLNYNLTAIKDRAVHFPANDQHVSVLGTLNLKVNAAIWMCIPVGIGEITAENHEEWFNRYRFFQQLGGHRLGETPAVDLTLEDVKHLIGLSTNVFPETPHDEWLTKMWDRVKEGSL
jgi:hypothetical protein